MHPNVQAAFPGRRDACALRQARGPTLREAGSFQLRKGEMREKLESDLED
jgi:hypothetical protein